MAIEEDDAPVADLTQDEGTLFANDGSFTDTDPLVDPVITADNGTFGDFLNLGNGDWSWTLLANDPDNDGPDSGTDHDHGHGQQWLGRDQHLRLHDQQCGPQRHLRHADAGRRG